MSCFYFTGMDVMECDKDVTVLTTSLRLIRGMKDYIWTRRGCTRRIKIRRLLEKVEKNNKKSFNMIFIDRDLRIKE